MLKTNYFKPSVLVPLTLLFLSTLSGCGSNDKEVSYPSAGVTQTFAEGKDSIPKNFPLPLYPEATAVGSVSAKGNNDAANYLSLTSADSLAKIANFYQEELPKEGWKIDSSQSLPKGISVSVSKGDLEGNVMVSSDDTIANITLTVSKNDSNEDVPENDKFTPNKLTPPTD